MKHLILTVTLFFLFVGFAYAESPSSVVSSDRAVRIFLNFEFEMEECRGGYQFERGIQTGTFTRGDITFKAQDKKVRYLTANKVVLVDVVGRGDRPLPGFPTPEGIAANFFMWVFCYDSPESFDPLASAFSYDAVLNTGNPIVLDVKPMSKKEEVAFKLPNGVNPHNLRLEVMEADGGFSRHGYDVREEKFIIYVNPLFEVRYRIFDAATSIVYVEGGVIDPLGGTTRPEVSVVNFMRPGNIVPVRFPESGSVFFENQILDGSLEVGEQIAPAKAYYMDLAQATLYIGTYGINGTIEVYQWLGLESEMQLLFSSPTPSGFSIPNGFGKVAVIVQGKVTERDGFFVSFSRGPLPLAGGKG